MGSNLDIIIVGAFMLMLMSIGLTFSRLVKTGSDYFRAGAKASWWLVGTNMFMGGISAYTFVGNAAGIYNAGWSLLAIYLANICGFLLAAAFLAAWYRQMRVVTYAEVIKERFGKVAQQLVTHLLVINGLMWSGAGLYTLSIFVAPLFPTISVQWLIFSVGLVTILLCSIGGNWAVLANDFVQGLILISVTVVVTVLCFIKAGGVSGFFSTIYHSAAASDLRFIKPTPVGQTFWTAPYGLTWIFITFILQFANQTSLLQGFRYYSAKDGREARKASILAGVMMLLGLVVFFVPPIYARVFLESDVLAMNASPEKAAEYAYSVACANVLPSGTFSFILLAIFATTISSLDTGLNRNAALIVRDLLPAYRKLLGLPPIRPDREVMFGKFATLILGGGVVSVALGYSMIKDTSIFDVMLTIIAQLISPQVIPLMLFLFIRKVPRWAIFSSLIGGYLPSLIILILSFTTNATFSYQQKGMLVLVGSVLGFAVARFFWNRVSADEKATTEAFYAKMMKPVDFESEVGKSNDSLQLVMIGRFSMIAGGLIMLLAIPVETSTGRLVVFSVSGFVGGVGTLIFFLGKRIQKKQTTQENVSL